MNSLELKKPVVLIVDDIPENLDVLIEHLESSEFSVSVALSGEEAIELTATWIPDIILLDVVMSGIDGFETCQRLKQQVTLQDVPIIFITALTETFEKVKGFMVGGVDYVTKPFQYEEVLARVNAHLTIRRQQQHLAQQNTELKQLNVQLQQEIIRREETENALQVADARLSAISQQEAESWGIPAFVGHSKTMNDIFTDIRRLQTVEKTNVFILGESGTGKELIARAIHFGGIRAKKTFIPVNCSAIPYELMESAFFGHVRGAFTGAVNNSKGYFELANGGTLFLDEIGDMPLPLQAKLLRVLEDGQITAVGSSKSQQVDVRVIAATNANLQIKMAANEFRQDLYFRLAGYTITLPPLRERKEDIPQLVEHFLARFAVEMGRTKATFTKDALTALENYHFPGNVRELKNILEHALISSGGQPIKLFHLHFIETPPSSSLPESLLTSESSTSIEKLEAPTEFTKAVLSTDTQKILAYVRKYGSINNTQCRQLIGSDYNRTSYLLKKMSAEGLLVREGKRRWATYQIP